MDVNQFLGGKWLKAADLDEGKRYELIIEGVEEYDAVNQKTGARDHWPVLRFQGWDKQFGLGTKTNLRQCIHNFGSTETDDWIGRKVVLFRTVTDYQGRVTPCIRIVPKEELQAVTVVTAPPPAGAPRDTEATTPDEFSDDEIPF